MKLIGIHGHAGAGKDTVAKHLAQKTDSEIVPFANPVKRAASEAFGIPLDRFYDRILKEVKDEYWNLSLREMTQIVGTEMFRELEEITSKYGRDFWVKRMEKELKDGFYDRVQVIIPDVRFQNEADWILSKKGIILHLTRPGYEGNVGIPGHASEAGINLEEGHKEGRVYGIVNNSDIDHLFNQVDACWMHACLKNLI